jgi:hypothetical protein
MLRKNVDGAAIDADQRGTDLVPRVLADCHNNSSSSSSSSVALRHVGKRDSCSRWATMIVVVGVL